MNNQHLYNGKLLPKDLADNYYVRNRLITELNDYPDTKLFFLQASAGYGKTQFVIHWLTTFPNKKAWITLDHYDNLPALFYRLFCQSLLTLQPDNENLKKILETSSFDEYSMELSLQAALAFLPETESPYVLVFDDFHHIQDENILNSLPFLLQRLPSSFKIVFITRGKIPSNIEEYSLTQDTKYVAEKELSYKQNDLLYLYRTANKKITPKSIVEIEEKTHGWPIAVHFLLAHPNLQRPEIEEQIFNYIEAELWTPLSEQTQLVYMKTSILDILTPALVTVLTGEKNGREWLVNIKAHNGFVQKSDDGTYYYLQIFQKFLLTKLDQHPMVSRKQLYLQLVDFYSTNNDVYKSLFYAIKSKDVKAILTYMRKYPIYQDFRVDIHEFVQKNLSSQINDVPKEIYTLEPSLHILGVWYFYLTGQAMPFQKHLDYVYNHAEELTKTAPKYVYELMLTPYLDYRLSLYQAVEKAKEFYREDFEVPSQKLPLTLQLPFLHRGLRDVSELSDNQLFEKLLPQFNWMFQRLKEKISIGIRGCLFIEKFQLEDALADTYEAYLSLEEDSPPEIRFSLSMQLIHVNYLLQNQGEFERHKMELLDWMEENEHSYLMSNFTAYNTRIKLWKGDKKTAKKWLEQDHVTNFPKKGLNIYQLYQHFTTIRAYLVLDDIHNALLLGNRILKFSLIFNRLLDTTEARVLLALSHWQLGNQKKAIKILIKALKATQKYQFITIYANEGTSLLPILKKIKNQLAQKSTKEDSFKTYVTKVYHVTFQFSTKNIGLIHYDKLTKIKLSKQQLNMIQFLSQGYSFSDIANLTNLSINTIKSHTSAAYQKLHVNSSTEAVTRAKELGLIE